MAKSRGKRRGSVSSANPRSYSDYLANQGQVEEPSPRAQPTEDTAKPEAVADDTVNWRGEYAQVFSDLRQLLLISVVLFVLMIVLGLVI